MFHRLLFMFSAIYGFFATFNRYLYQVGIKKRHKLPRPVISVGNISVGGTGKTPVVVAIYRYFQHIGKSPVVLSRGYKRKAKENVICDETMSVYKCGDEPLLMAKKGIKVVVGKDRLKSAKMSITNLNPDVFILDDGFQHHRIYKDFNIMVVDATRPFWKDHLLPAGRLREPASFYRYADCFLITRIDRVKERERFIEEVERFKKPFFIVEESFGSLYNTVGKRMDFSELTDREVVVMAGLGNNSQFFQKMIELSKIHRFKVAEFLNFPDHYDYEGFLPNVNKIYLTTEKDIVKLKYENVYAVEYQLRIEEGFYRYMMEKIYGREKPA